MKKSKSRIPEEYQIPDDLSKWNGEQTAFLNDEELNFLIAHLDIYPERRTKADCITIADLVKKFKFFGPYKDSELFPDLCKQLRMEYYKAKDIVFRQGDRGDCLYFILNGTVSINVYLPYSPDGSAGMKELVKLSQGAIFGELALMQDSPRTATVIIVENAILMSLDKQSFQKFIKDPKALALPKIKQIFRSIGALEVLSQKKIDELANRCILRKFDTNTLLIKQGSQTKYFCFIKNGFTKVFRSIHFRVDLDTKELNGDFIDPSIDEVEAGLVRTLNIEMAEIGAGEMFADYAAINEKTMDYTVITTIPSDIILVRAKDLFAILNKEEIEAFRKECPIIHQMKN